MRAGARVRVPVRVRVRGRARDRSAREQVAPELRLHPLPHEAPVQREEVDPLGTLLPRLRLPPREHRLLGALPRLHKTPRELRRGLGHTAECRLREPRERILGHVVAKLDLCLQLLGQQARASPAVL